MNRAERLAWPEHDSEGGNLVMVPEPTSRLWSTRRRWGVLVVDAGSREVVMANREARRIVGEHAADARSAHDLRGLTCRRVDGSAVAVEDLPVVRAVQKGEAVQAEELVIRRPDGSEVTTLVNATPIRSDDGELGVLSSRPCPPAEHVGHHIKD